MRRTYPLYPYVRVVDVPVEWIPQVGVTMGHCRCLVVKEMLGTIRKHHARDVEEALVDSKLRGLAADQVLEALVHNMYILEYFDHLGRFENTSALLAQLANA